MTRPRSIRKEKATFRSVTGLVQKKGHKVENKRFNLAFGGRHDEERGEKRNCVVSRRVEVFSSSACDSVSECGAHARAQSDAAGSAAPLFETARPMVSASSALGSTTTIMEVARPRSPQEQGDKKCAQDENLDGSAT